jgi:CRP/FNR family transcriptional regulator, cyclic AMP receptor protein
VAILGPADFTGEGCLAGQEIRMGMGTATAIGPTAVVVVEKKEMMRVLHAEPSLSDPSWLTSFRETFESRRI